MQTGNCVAMNPEANKPTWHLLACIPAFANYLNKMCLCRRRERTCCAEFLLMKSTDGAVSESVFIERKQTAVRQGTSRISLKHGVYPGFCYPAIGGGLMSTIKTFVCNHHLQLKCSMRKPILWRVCVVCFKSIMTPNYSTSPNLNHIPSAAPVRPHSI